jgi:hypothetical protein
MYVVYLYVQLRNLRMPRFRLARPPPGGYQVAADQTVRFDVPQTSGNKASRTAETIEPSSRAEAKPP